MNVTEKISIEDYKRLTKKKRKSKYNAEICEYAGRKYDSKGEMEYAIKLEWRKKAGEILEIIPQYPISIEINGIFICNYVVDFKICLSDGSVEYHEFKGVETDLWKLKWKLVKALNPEWNFVLIKNE